LFQKIKLIFRIFDFDSSVRFCHSLKTSFKKLIKLKKYRRKFFINTIKILPLPDFYLITFWDYIFQIIFTFISLLKFNFYFTTHFKIIFFELYFLFIFYYKINFYLTFHFGIIFFVFCFYLQFLHLFTFNQFLLDFIFLIFHYYFRCYYYYYYIDQIHLAV
jgi:hypothetical protein